MAYHANNHAFDELMTSSLEQVCTAPDEDADLYNATYDATIVGIDAAVLNTEQECKYADETFELLGYVENNPPQATDLITIIEGNTQMFLAVGAEAVDSVLARGSCVDGLTGQADAEASKRIRSKLDQTGLQQSVYSTIGVGSDAQASSDIHFLALPNVYHKAALMCLPGYSSTSGNTTNVGVCVGDDHNLVQSCDGSAAIEANPIFDLVTSTDIATCFGDKCKAAARAVVKYQALLGPITAMRWDTYQVTSGYSGEMGALMDQSTWTFQRSCAALESIVDKAMHVQEALPGVIEDLRLAAPQLTASCIAPGRVGDFLPAPPCLDAMPIG